MNTNLTEADLIRLWEQHTELEFATKDAVATVATMTPRSKKAEDSPSPSRYGM
jgi:hypothetical protein